MDAIITVLVGFYFSAIGYGLISSHKDPVKNAENLRKFGSLYRIAGPIVMIAGALLLLAALGRN